LKVIDIHIPPLRERIEDIPTLAGHFFDKFSVIHEKQVKGISQEALYHLMVRDWPGNIRELENVIERGVIMAAGDILVEEDLLNNESIVPETARSDHPMGDIFTLPFKEAKERLIEEFQVQYIARALARNGGNISQAAKDSGVKRQYLHRLIRETNIDSKAFKKPDSSD
jgi:DNA-binding NtrC family response regulator